MIYRGTYLDADIAADDWTIIVLVWVAAMALAILCGRRQSLADGFFNAIWLFIIAQISAFFVIIPYGIIAFVLRLALGPGDYTVAPFGQTDTSQRRQLSEVNRTIIGAPILSQSDS